MSGRTSLQALARGRGDGAVIAVPLALPTAARIQERDWEDFLEDPTQLANGLRDLHQALAPDGLAVTDAGTLVEQAAGGLVEGAHARAAVEAVGRLRTSLGDDVVLIAPVPGPGRVADAGPDDPTGAVQEIGKALLAVGADVLLVVDDGEPDPGLSTLANIARFHQGLVAIPTRSEGPGPPLVPALEVDLEQPASGAGLTITPGTVPRETDLTVIEDWIETVHD